MIDPFTIAQTHPSLETRPPVQTHTMLEKTKTIAYWYDEVTYAMLINLL